MADKEEEKKAGLKTAKLIMVTTDNNNKFYDMQENADGSFTVSYGRVGGRATVASYNMREWNSKYNEKTRKGYTDQTHLFAEKSADDVEFADIASPQVAQLFNELMRYSKKSVSQNYNVSADQVTRKQVTEAQRLVDLLVSKATLNTDNQEVNKLLLDLYKIIPRKMSNVNDFLFKEKIDTKDKLDKLESHLMNEQATLDVMSGQVEISEKRKVAMEAQPKEKVSLLDTLGIDVDLVTDASVIKQIKDLMQENADKFKNAYAVTHHKSRKKFDVALDTKKDKKLELFWHGSRNENWISILETSLVLRPANAVISGKMFGYGIYFADKFKKSLNYTSLRGAYWTGGGANQAFLALFDVHVGKQFHIQKHQSWCYELNEDNLKKQGADYDSLFAEGGADLVNNEYIVYNDSQCSIRYLVEVGV